MREDIAKLKAENERLSRIAETDWLTGLYNRGAVEKRVNQSLAKTGTGIMLVFDVDYFRQVNTRCGHITGDHTLQEIARILRVMVLPRDIVARIGGDEFVIFMPVNRDSHFAQERSQQIKNRLASISLPDDAVMLSVSAGWAVAEENDNYQSVFERADRILLTAKQKWDEGETEKSCPANNGIEMDIKQIREELSEHDLIKGAYCQDYETFKGIYRFMERRLHRTKSNVYIILFTLTNGAGDLTSLADREAGMGYLKDRIQGCLRSADVFTQYSSGQFLVMVSDVTCELAEMIAERIETAFYKDQKRGTEDLLLHHCYPLTPVRPAITVRHENA